MNAGLFYLYPLGAFPLLLLVVVLQLVVPLAHSPARWRGDAGPPRAVRVSRRPRCSRRSWCSRACSTCATSSAFFSWSLLYVVSSLAVEWLGNAAPSFEFFALTFYIVHVGYAFSSFFFFFLLHIMFTVP